MLGKLALPNFPSLTVRSLWRELSLQLPRVSQVGEDELDEMKLVMVLMDIGELTLLQILLGVAICPLGLGEGSLPRGPDETTFIRAQLRGERGKVHARGPVPLIFLEAMPAPPQAAASPPPSSPSKQA